MFVKITALDTLFFRTGRPFTGGEDTWADLIFPPSPSTIYGAIRSLMIFKRGGGLKALERGDYIEDLGKIVRDENTKKVKEVIKGKLSIKGPFLYKDELLFPASLDLVKEKKEEKLIPINFSKKPVLFISKYPFENVLIHKPIKDVDEARGWLTANYIIDYLKGESNYFGIVPDEELYILEPKIGIARDKTSLTTKERHLYIVPTIRMKKGVSLITQIEGLTDFPDSGVLQLGGESKASRFEKLNDDLFLKLSEIDYNFDSGYFKIYLATPAIFKNGWIPEWINNDGFEGEYNGIKLKLVSCAIGKPIAIGGWNIAKKTAKPLQKAVPTGSVYYFKILTNSDKEKIKDVFHLKNISDINPEEGFGLSVVGEVKI